MERQATSALSVPTTPAYVYSESLLLAAAERAAEVALYAGCKLLYTLKACALAPVLETLAPWLHGFAGSSVFEVRVAEATARADQSLHCYSPAYPVQDLEAVLSMADYVSLNSWGQLDEASGLNGGRASLGLRINPEMSFASDSRYDPCRPHSKLGVPLSSLVGDTATLRTNPRVDGLLIHSNCESHDLAELAETVEAMSGFLGRMDGLAWFNLGGGYYLGRKTIPNRCGRLRIGSIPNSGERIHRAWNGAGAGGGVSGNRGPRCVQKRRCRGSHSGRDDEPPSRSIRVRVQAASGGAAAGGRPDYYSGRALVSGGRRHR